jgi:hypothetical protein
MGIDPSSQSSLPLRGVSVQQSAITYGVGGQAAQGPPQSTPVSPQSWSPFEQELEHTPPAPPVPPVVPPLPPLAPPAPLSPPLPPLVLVPPLPGGPHDEQAP